MLKIGFKKLHKDTVIPKIESEGACCMDVVATEIIETEPGKITVKLGFATEFPRDYKGVIVPRSSFTQKGWIVQNSPGQIDSDYRGEWMIKFEGIPKYINTRTSFTYYDFPYKPGDRVAQVFFEKKLEVEFIELNELTTTKRGEGGFGSTNLINNMIEDVNLNREDRKID